MSHLPGHRRGHRAFSLVELAIVISMLAILAAIVVPRYTAATGTARENGLQRQLQTVRGQLEKYRTENGQYPPSVATGTDWSDMVDTRYLLTAPRNSMLNDAESIAAGGTIGFSTAVPGGAAFYFDTDVNILYAAEEDGTLYDF